MPYQLIWEDRGVVFRFSGVASDQDLQQSNRDVFDHPRFADIDYQVVDFTDVTQIDFSSAVIRWSADWDLQASKLNPSIRVAVAADQMLLIGLANMYRTLFDLQDGPWEQGLFATLDEARAWLAGED